MRKVKRFAALLLCGALTLSALTGCGGDDSGSGKDSSAAGESKSEESKTDDAAGADEADDAGDAGDESSAASGDKVHFTWTSYNCIAGKDYNDPLMQYIGDKFGVDIEVMANEPSGAAEKFRIGVTGGSLPNSANWEGFSVSEYYSYIDQGLLKPLPDGWETTYPNIAKMVQASSIADILKVDGKTYAVPHVVFNNFVEMDPPINHATLFFRKDWAAEVGMPDLGKDYKITISELKEYLEKVQAAGLTNDGAFVSDSAGNINQMFGYATGTPYGRSFIETESGFKYSYEADKDLWINMIKTMREWFKAGLIDPDYAVVNDIYDARAALMAGTLAAMFDSGDCANTNTYMTGYQGNFPDQDPYEHIGGAHILTDDGSAYILEVTNFWTVQVFAPETDDATMAKILEVMDWACSPEGELSTVLGIPEVDWKYNDEGKPEAINTIDITLYPSTEILPFGMSHCNDEIGYSGASATIDQRAIDQSMAIFDVKKSGTVIPYEYNYGMVFNSTTKDNYSVNVDSKINELVAGDEDIEAAWDTFLEENKAMWEPLLNELNEHFGY